jgi:AraC family transcriptional regulator
MGDLPDLANLDYVVRVNRAIDHVTRHLDAPLSLEEVARVACFSPFHFHRVFRSIQGETLHDFVSRVRLERALYLIAHTGRPRLTQVALACGFNSSSDFSRRFRKRFGVAPRAFDVKLLRDTRRAEMMRALPGGQRLQRLPEGENPDGFKVTIRALPARRVAYLRVLRPYQGQVPETAARLVAWANARGLTDRQWLGYQWDDPEIVPLDLCRYDVGLEIGEGIPVDDGVSEARFAALKVAEIAISGGIELEMRALDYLYRTWLPTSGYVPDHQPIFEAWRGKPFEDGFTHFELRLQLPVTEEAPR